MEIIKVENVVKQFGQFRANDDISFSAESGRILGLLGPNGAGKTTMIRMITNIFYPDQGRITVFNEPISSRHQNRIGYLPEERGLYKKIKVLEQIIYFARLKGVPRNEAMKRARFWLEKLDAADWANKKVQELSKGMQQKVQFITTIVHDPELLILDEPFSGFDPVNTELLKGIILEMKAAGKTIVLSTHIMEQAEQLCDDICLINKGKIVLQGRVSDIKKKFGRDTVIMEFEGSDSFLSNLEGVKVVSRSNNRLEMRLTNGSVSINDIIAESLKNLNLYKLEINEPSLHEIFIEVVSGKEGSGNGKA